MSKIYCKRGISFDVLYGLVRGTVQWKKCPLCGPDGHVYYNKETLEGHSTDLSTYPEELRGIEFCENCHGLGFILFDITSE